jgi:hypothetical protein
MSVCLILLAAGPAVAAKDAPKVYVILWFDTEDYLLPASDDAAKNVAEYLTKQGIRATFKVVGEKARTLERRKRSDVIAALKKHEIGYHANWHSVQPTPALYLSNLGWDEGVAEFDRREGPGRADVERIFGQAPTCYGQPGSSWGPQSFGAMKKWGMPIYLDAGKHVSLDGKPHYFAGLFTLYHLTHTIRAELTAPKELDKAKARFAQARKQLLAEGGGVVSIVYHPCEWVHKEFWDGVNFRQGANPPRRQWKIPAMKSAADTKAAYFVFSQYIDFIKRFPDVQFVTASEAARLYPDLAKGMLFKSADLKAVAAAGGDGVTYQKHKGYSLAASEVLSLLCRYVSQRADGKVPDQVALTSTPLGPTGNVVELKEVVTTDASQFRRATRDVADYLARHERVPSAVWLGSTPVPPEAFLRSLAKVAATLLAGAEFPSKIEVRPTNLTAAKHVADDDPRLWGWVIFPPKFRAPAIMNLAKRQAWTIKPALLKGENK